MSEQGGDESSDKPCFPTTTLAAVLLDSFNIFLKNLPLYLYIFFFTTLPLSFLLFSLSLSSRPVTTLVRHLEALALLAPTRFESRHLWKESRREAVSLLRLRALYLLPSYALSITAATSAVASAAAALSGKRPTLATAAAAVRLTWKRTLATSICVYGIMMGYNCVRRIAEVTAGEMVAGILIVAVGDVVDVYLAAVMSLGLVASIVEERFGWEAIQVGWGEMAKRKVSGWVLSGGFLVMSGVISWELEWCLKGQDLSEEGGWTALMKWLGQNSSLVCLFGLVVLWSYIVNTVFYFECKRKHGVNE